MAITIGGKTPQSINIGGKEVQSLAINGEVVWSLSVADYFWINSTDSRQQTLSVTKNGSPTTGTDLQWSKDKATWTTVTYTDGVCEIPVTHEKVYFRSTTGFSNGTSNYYSFDVTDVFDVGGKLETLINYNGSYTAAAYSFNRMFKDSNNLVDASALDIELTNFPEFCCLSMFEGCTNLVSAPVLPYTTLSRYCYSYMFDGCSSLTTAPALQATTLAEHCYECMFRNTGITVAPALRATTMAPYCYAGMFWGTPLTTPPTLSSTVLADHCYYSMFRGCSSLASVPALNATTLATHCYNNMFNGCTSLTSTKKLPATTLAANCYYSMFLGCTGLTYISELPATTLASECYYQMFRGCTGLISVRPNLLPATTMESKCYGYMFLGCTNLQYGPELPATTLAADCYNSMFYQCSSLKRACTELPATASASQCYFQMYCYCTTLQIAPDIYCSPDTTNAFKYMFYGCSALDKVYIESKTWNTTNAANWLYGVAAFGHFVEPHLTVSSISASGYPSGWFHDAYDYFYVENTTSSAITVTINRTGSPGSTIYRTPTPETSNSWSACSFSNNKYTYSLNAGSRLYFRCSSGFSKSSSAYYKFSNTPKVGGDLRTLGRYTYYTDTEAYQSANYYNMFNANTSLTDISHLVFHRIKTLKADCYHYMFINCTNITEAPELGFTTNANSSCYCMFKGCTSLTKGPRILAAENTSYAYREMFSGCTALTVAPILCGIGLSSGGTPEALYQMFYNCSNINEIATYAQSWSTGAAENWLYGVAATGTFYSLGFIPSGMTLIIPSGASGKPSGWTNKTSF